MNIAQQQKAAKDFAAKWAGKGYEKGDSQKFWLSLLLEVFGIEHPAEYISFEDKVALDHTSFIDGFIPATKVMIEQKSLGKDLRKPIKQSDGSSLTPFQQAKRYAAELPYSSRPRWIITCNFAQFLIYDMEQPNGEPEEVLLENLEKEFYRLNFLIKQQDEHIKKELEVSIKAGQLVGKIYDILRAQYDPSTDEQEILRSLNVLCVRLVFCMYAEDAGIFGQRNMFCDYMRAFKPEHARRALKDLFEILNTPIKNRDPYAEEILLAFPYVNGGLFAEDNIIIPRFTQEVVDLIINEAADGFDWSDISPTIFGAVFESTLNPDTRRSGGMHYTSIENIHKVIDPLFLDDLREEYAHAVAIMQPKQRHGALQALQKKLGSLTFFDPACGSGNFLTETYISLRRMENEILTQLQKNKGQIQLGFEEEEYDPIQVKINQFYGIEINDFAVTVAKTALWIAESQMMKETEKIVSSNMNFLPLTTNAFIHEGNALQIDWQSIIPSDKLNYIMGNPPFVGYSLQSKEQKADMLSIYVDEKGKPYKTAGKIDYVAGWYFKAAEYMQGSNIQTAFVSTNSITQGEQVAAVWKPLYDRFDIKINFAWSTFKWNSESNEKAAVHCVIVGFAPQSRNNKIIFSSSGQWSKAENISPYIINADTTFIESRNKPICDTPEMTTGNRPADGGHLIIEAADYADFIKREPTALPYIKKLVGAKEFINNLPRYCLWLVGVSPSELKKMPMVMERIRKCQEDRANAPDEGRRKLADRPALFRETKNPDKFIIIPKVSSENRRYIPMGLSSGDTICSDLVFILPDTAQYHFGILESNVHMAWMRAVAGRLKSDYRYSKDIVYNNFPWPTPTDSQKEKIEKTAQAILDARALYPDSSLADLYDETLMPPELRKAHKANDRAVMEAYGFWGKVQSESECVAELMKMYQQLTQQPNIK